jgi:16S rRNA (guanine966-N2)-methyltransferase
MRIIAGSLGGRQFSAPSGYRTHPMSDKIRGALFNVLGDINGLSVLDPFAGSGAISFEAISRGAISALAIETDKQAQKTIASNITSLGLAASVKLVNASASAWLASTASRLGLEDCPLNSEFDVIICDPPYDGVRPKLLTSLAARASRDGVIIFSLPKASEFQLPTTHYKLKTTKSYGDARLDFYRKTENPLAS